MTIQLSHTQIINNDKKFPIVIVAENLRTPENVGMIFRIAEAFGIEKIYFIGETTKQLNRKRISKISRNTIDIVASEFTSNIASLVYQLKQNNYSLLGLDITSTSVDITNFDFRNHKKIALFVGSERNGISNDILTELDKTIHINMHGKNSSINVVNALSICLYETTKQMQFLNFHQ